MRPYAYAFKLLKTVSTHNSQRGAFAVNMVRHFAPIKNAKTVRKVKSANTHQVAGGWFYYL
jgi:hypothetical protein